MYKKIRNVLYNVHQKWTQFSFYALKYQVYKPKSAVF